MSFATLPRSTRSSPAALRIIEAERRFVERAAAEPPAEPTWAKEAEEEHRRHIRTVRERAAREVRSILPMTVTELRSIVQAVADRLHREMKGEREMDIATVLERVAEATGVSVADIRGPRRLSAIIDARFAAIYLAREFTQATNAMLGRKIGGRDHTTIGNALNQASARLISDPGFAATVDRCRQAVLGNREPVNPEGCAVNSGSGRRSLFIVRSHEPTMDVSMISAGEAA